MILQVIICTLFPALLVTKWHRRPPPSPQNFRFSSSFIQEYNKGLFPSPKFYRYKAVRKVQHSTLECNLGNSKPTISKPISIAWIAAKVNSILASMNPTTSAVRSTSTNAELLTMLYMLATPGKTSEYTFDTDSEKICIDTGASACTSNRKASFHTLKDTPNMQINGNSLLLVLEI